MVHDLSESLRQIAIRYRLADVYVFGSRAAEIAACVRGDATAGCAARPESDVDIGVRPQARRRLAVHERVDLASELEDLLSARRVDLVVVPEAKAFLARDIIAGELLYCADPDEQAEYELYVLRRAGDLAPFERERREFLLGERS